MSRDRSEFVLIDWIRARAGSHLRLPVGIGDDAAVLAFTSPSKALVTVDMLLEGVHFRMPPATPTEIGRKALAVNLSDIAAMAGRPLAAFISVALSAGRGQELAHELYAGIQDLAREFGVAIAGGDTNAWNGPLVISITIVGEATPRGPVLRSGAQPGDWIFVTGELGGSLAGKHITFVPRVREALKLHEAADLTAMIDVSDGLAADLHHILDESRVGAVLHEKRIPISPDAITINDGRTPLEHALSDGEDFELLFTLPAAAARALLKQPPCEVRLSHIGEIREASGCEIVDASGGRLPLGPLGWSHAL